MKTTDNSVPSKSGNSWPGRLIAWIHLWPGLLSSLVLAVLCLTGTLIVYGDEVTDFVNRDVLHVKKAGDRVETEWLLDRYQASFPGRGNPDYLVVYRDQDRSVRLYSSGGGKGHHLVFMDPYTGEILREDGTVRFFYFMAHLHGSLLWTGPGSWITGIAAIIFFTGLISGLYLWWPARWTKAARRVSFAVNVKARFKRLNYDLHNVLGFYAFSVCLLLALTGLLISFEPFAHFTSRLFGGDPARDWKRAAGNEGGRSVPLNQVLDSIFSKNPDKNAIQVMTGRWDDAAYYRVNAAVRIGLRSCENCDSYVLDRYTGKPADLPAAVLEHMDMENGYWALHMGTWMGQAGKLVTFTGGLIATSLPVTGFLIWWGRRKKPGRRARKAG